MISAKIPGKLTCYRYGENIFSSDYEAVHGGGAANYLLRYDIAKIFREKASSFYETAFPSQRNRYHSRLHCIVAQELHQAGRLDSLREWTPARFEGRCRIDAFRADSVSSLFDAFAFDPEFIIADGYHLSFPVLIEQKSLYSLLHENCFESVFTGTQQRLPCRFTVSRGNLQWTNRSLYDSLRTWTPDSYRGVFDQKGKLESLWHCRLATLNDPAEWPTRVRKQYSGIVANPVFYQFRVSARNGFIDPLLWTSFLFGYDVFLYFYNDYSLDRQAFVRPGWRVMAKNLETNEVSEFVENESHERPGYICLAIREEDSRRLIADMSDYPDDVPGFVERVKEEANTIANAKELRDMLQKLVASAEPILIEFEAEAQKKCLGEREQPQSHYLFEFAVDDAAALLKKIAGE